MVDPLKQFGVPPLNLDDFNNYAQKLGFDFRWKADLDGDGLTDPDEIIHAHGKKLIHFVKSGKFTNDFQSAYLKMVEAKRRDVVALSYSERMPVNVEVDLTHLSVPKKDMVLRLMDVAKLVDELYMKMMGARDYLSDVQANAEADRTSYDLFLRNRGPWCEAPATANDPHCNAHRDFPEQRVDIHPKDVADYDLYCQELEKKGDEFKNPFTAVLRGAEGLLTIPTHEKYRKECHAIANALEFAAQAIAEVTEEHPTYEYLMAAAESWRTGDWAPSDRLWVELGASNSEFAMRIALDEPYADPCQMRGMPELWFGIIDTEASQFVQKLGPRLDDMQASLASFHPHLEPQPVNLDLPTFVRTAIRAGDADEPSGGIVGQMLPNWTDVGKLRNNIFVGMTEDPKIAEQEKEKVKAVLHPETLEACGEIPPQALDRMTVLHELTHSLGVNLYKENVINPDGTPRLDETGKPLSISGALGGRTTSRFEEIRAETGAMYWVGWMQQRNLLTESEVHQLYVVWVMWALGHLREGMVDEETGSPKTYSQLAGVQFAAAVDAGAVEFRDDRFLIHFDQMHAVFESLMTEVIDITVSGDKTRAESMLEGILQGTGYDSLHLDFIKAQLSPFPKVSYTFDAKLG